MRYYYYFMEAHKGERFEDLPRDYLERLAKQDDMDDRLTGCL